MGTRRRIRNHTCMVFILISIGLKRGAISDSSLVVTPDSSSYCRGQEAIFTCVVEGVRSFAWESDEYIGPGGDQFAFSVLHPNGDKKFNNFVNGTYALLVNTEERLMSTLHLYALFNGTISCVVLDPPGLMTNVTISIIDVDSSECQLDRVVTTEKPPDSTTITESDPSPNLETAHAGNNSAVSSAYAYTNTANFMTIIVIIIIMSLQVF